MSFPIWEWGRGVRQDNPRGIDITNVINLFHTCKKAVPFSIDDKLLAMMHSLLLGTANKSWISGTIGSRVKYLLDYARVAI